MRVKGEWIKTFSLAGRREKWQSLCSKASIATKINALHIVYCEIDDELLWIILPLSQTQTYTLNKMLIRPVVGLCSIRQVSKYIQFSWSNSKCDKECALDKLFWFAFNSTRTLSKTSQALKCVDGLLLISRARMANRDKERPWFTNSVGWGGERQWSVTTQTSSIIITITSRPPLLAGWAEHWNLGGVGRLGILNLRFHLVQCAKPIKSVCFSQQNTHAQKTDCEFGHILDTH